MAYDPFAFTSEAQHLRAFVTVIVAGVDVTQKLDPHLVSVVVIDEVKSEADIELDDRDATLPLPPLGSPVQVAMGWMNGASEIVFNGYIADLEYAFGRKEGGRRMFIHCEGGNLMSQINSPMQNNWGEGAPPGQEIGNMVGLSSVLGEAAQHAGATLGRISPQFANIKRDYWSQNGVSFNHLGQSIAEEVGGMWGIRDGNQGHLVSLDDTQGSAVAQWGVNLIGLRVRPLYASGTWAGNNQQFFSAMMGQWNSLQQMLKLPMPFGGFSQQFQPPRPAPNDNDAAQQNGGGGSGYAGKGRVLINGNPSIKVPFDLTISGVRAGVDGAYTVVKVEHHYNRNGYVTWVDVLTKGTAGASTNVGTAWPLPHGIAGLPPATTEVPAARGPGVLALPGETFTSAAPDPGAALQQMLQVPLKHP